MPFERALALDPTGLGALTNVGSIYVKAGRLEDGAHAFERAIALHAEAIIDQVSTSIATWLSAAHLVYIQFPTVDFWMGLLWSTITAITASRLRSSLTRHAPLVLVARRRHAE